MTETTDTGTTDTETAEESDDERRIEVVNCSAVRVTGDFERVAVDSSFYAADGAATNTQEFGPVEGTTVIDLAPGDGIAGESIDHVAAYESEAGSVTLEQENPNQERCWSAIQPEPVNLSFVGAEPVGNGTYEATFEYTNPNDEALAVAGSTFTNGTVSGEPPTDLQPGTHTVAVEWTPASNDERLTWELNLRPFGHETVNATGTVEAARTTDSDDDGPEPTDTERGPGETTDSDEADESPEADEPSDGSGEPSTANDERSASGEAERSGSGDASAESGATASEPDAPDATSTAEQTAGQSGESNAADDGALAEETATMETEIVGGVESPGQPGMGPLSAFAALFATALLVLRGR